MAWRLKKVEDQRKALIEAYIAGEISMTELCSRFGISRTTAYKWYNRYVIADFDETSLQDLSRAPLEPHRVFSETQIRTIINLKRDHRDWGPKKLLVVLQREYPRKKWPSATRLYEILKEHHYVTSRRLRRRVCATHPLGELKRTNDVWLADFKGWFLTENGEKCEPLTITDGLSRYLIRCVHLPNKRVEHIWPIFDEAFREYGLPKRIRTDNGPPFGCIGVGRLTRLSVKLIKAGVTPEWINPGHPEENGRHERFHLTLKQAIASPPAKTLNEQICRMEKFQREYNFVRPHEALDMQTPGSCYSMSTRSWDGVLRTPEYNTLEKIVRKVLPSGCIGIRGNEHYVGRALIGEYVGFQEDEEGNYEVFYGPVYLGKIKKSGIEQPRRLIRKKVAKV